MVNIKTFVQNLHPKDGIYFTEELNEISYPEDGNQICFQLEENSFWFEHRNNCILELVKKYAPNDLFFDIGGGNGFVARNLEKNGINSVLVEPGLSGCLNAKKRGLSNVICSTLENTVFSLNSLPAVGVFDVVEHIEDDLGFLQSIHQYLEENGLIFITVPAYNFLWSNEDVDAGHFRRYTLNSIEAVLKDASFKVEYSSYIFSLLPLPIFLLRSIPSKLGFHKNSNEFDKHEKEHTQSKGFLGRLLDKLWLSEANAVKNGRRIPLGSSCLVVARKV